MKLKRRFKDILQEQHMDNEGKLIFEELPRWRKFITVYLGWITVDLRVYFKSEEYIWVGLVFTQDDIIDDKKFSNDSVGLDELCEWVDEYRLKIALDILDF